MLYDFQLRDLEGKPVAMKSFAGKALLVVNTASKCGYTPQYTELQALYEQNKDKGLVVLGFPSNDFGAQEPGSDKEIASFCQKNYGVTFPLFTKGPVSGREKQPVFQYLTQEANLDLKGEVEWNFEKFLIDRKGKLVARFKSSIGPKDKPLLDAITNTLK